VLRNTKWSRSFAEYMASTKGLYGSGASFSSILGHTFKENILDVRDHGNIVTMPVAKSLTRGIKKINVSRTAATDLSAPSLVVLCRAAFA